MIRLQNLTKYYPLKDGERHYVLKDVTLDIPSNENLGILGPNGAGKSTLLRMIGGAEAPNSGKIITTANVSWPLGVGVGFQKSLTGRQNIQFVCDVNGLSKQETNEVFESVIEFAELGKFFDMPVRAYSSGMRARLGFGLSITFEFDYYLIDELTSVGDAIFRKKANAAFEQIREKASLIFVAHNLKTLEKSCDSALFLRNGEATYYADIKEGIKVYKKFIAEDSGPSFEELKRARKLRKLRRLKKARRIEKIKKREKRAERAKVRAEISLVKEVVAEQEFTSDAKADTVPPKTEKPISPPEDNSK